MKDFYYQSGNKMVQRHSAYVLAAALLIVCQFAFGQMEVTIDGTGGNDVVISVPSGTFFGTEGNITFQNGVAGFDNQGTVELKGNWNKNTASGGLINNAGTVLLDGAAQTIGGSVSTTFNNLTLAGSGIKTTALATTISGTLDLADRELATGGLTLNVTNTSTGAITRTTGFISSTAGGVLARATNSTGTYLFPVGGPSGGIFRPIEISPANTTNNTYQVRFVGNNPTTNGYTTSSTDGVVCSVNTAYYHLITQSSGQGALLTMYFSSGLDGNFLNMAHWQGAPVWTNMGSLNSVSAYGLSGWKTAANWTDFTYPAFAFAYPTTPAAPVATASINNACGSFTAKWNASTNALTYLLDVSTDYAFGSFVSGYNALNVGNVTSYNVTGLTAGTTYYYRLRAQNFCGTSGYSNIIAAISSSSVPPSLSGSATTAGIVNIDYDGYISTGKKNCWYFTGNPTNYPTSPFPDPLDMGFGGGVNGATITIPGHAGSNWSGLKYTYKTASPPCGAYAGVDLSTVNSSTPDIAVSLTTAYNANPYNASNATLAYSSGLGTSTLVLTGTTKTRFVNSSGSLLGADVTVNTRIKLVATGSAGVWQQSGTLYYVRYTGDYNINVLAEADASAWASGMYTDNTQQTGCPYQTCATLFGSYPGANYYPIFWFFSSQHGSNYSGGNAAYGYGYSAFNPRYGQPVALSGSITSQTNITCNGLSNGSVTVQAANGTANYQYKIDGGGYGAATSGSNTFSGLSVGAHTVTILDALGCTTTVPVTITQPTVVSTPAVTVAANVTGCNGGNNGSITVSTTSSGGTGTISYFLNGLGTGQTTTTFGSLTAGNYYVVAKDANGCASSQSNTVTITQPTVITTPAVTVTANVTGCNGGNNGSINVTTISTGGTGTISYFLNGAGTGQTTTSFAGLTAGGYYVVAKDANSCASSNSNTVTVTQPTALSTPVVSVTANVTGCNGGANGSINVSTASTGGTGTISYFLNGAGTGQTATSFAGLTAGSYFVVAKDVNNCASSQSNTISVTQPTTVSTPVITLAANVTGCNGGNNGSFTVTTASTGGTGTINYFLNGTGTGQTSTSFSGLTAGNYYVVAKDANSCASSQSNTISISQPSIVTTPVITLGSNVSTCGGVDGSFTVTTTSSGGTGTIKYYLNGAGAGQTSVSFTGLSSGNYFIVAKDANNCASSSSNTINVGQPAAPNVSNFSTTATSPICANGVSAVTVSSSSLGNATFTAIYNLSSPNSATGLTATLVMSGGSGTFNTAALANTGTTTVTITSIKNALNCSSAPGGGNTANVVVNAGPAVSITNAADVCFGGQVTLGTSVSGGAGSNTNFLWERSSNGGSNWTTVSNPGTGSYQTDPSLPVSNNYVYRVTLTQSGSNCSAVSANVSANVKADPGVTNPSNVTLCVGGSAQLAVTGTGGTPTLLYEWEYPSTSIVTNGNPVGTTYTGVTSNTLNVATNGSTPPGTTSYWVKVSAAGNGCDVTWSNFADITVNAVPVVSITNAANVCIGGQVTLGTNVTGGAGTNDNFKWERSANGGGSWVTVQNSAAASYTTSSTLGLGSYLYKVTLTQSISSCSAVSSNVSANVVAQPTIAPGGATVDICKGGGTTFTVSPGTGGTPALLYEWEYVSNGNIVTNGTPAGHTFSGETTTSLTISTDNTTTPAGTTPYWLKVYANGNGCSTTYTLDYNLTVHPDPVVTTNPASGYVCPGGNSTIHVVASGGVTPLLYEWEYFSNSAIVTNNNPTNVTYTGSTTPDLNIAALASTPPGIVPYYVKVTSAASGCDVVHSASANIDFSCGYVWTGLGPDNHWTTSGNWNIGVPVNSCGSNVTIPFAVPHFPLLTGNVSVGNVILEGGANIDLAANTMSVCGHWTGGVGTASTVTGTGSVILMGGGAQALSGKTQFQTLHVTKPTGTVATMQPNSFFDVYVALELESGDFNTGSGTLTFKSTSVSQCAVLDNFSYGPTPGTIAGSIYAERFYAAPSANSYDQHFMGTPVSNAGLGQFGAGTTFGFVTPNGNCDETQLDWSSVYGTVFSYDQSNGTYCSMAGWKVESNAGNAIPAKGYSVAKTGSGTLTVTGTPNLNSSYTATGANGGWTNMTLQQHPMASGWMLVSNPYLATLDYTGLSAQPGLDAQIKVWHTTGGFAGSYQNATVLAPFQAFFVHKTNAGGTATYTLNANRRTRNPQTFQLQANDQELTITAANTGTGLLDVTTVAFNSDATDTFDVDYDANKLSGSVGRHNLYSLNNGIWMSNNILQNISQTSTVDVGLDPQGSGSYTFSFTGLSSFDPTSYITLEDKKLNIFYDVRSGDYSFTSDSTDAWNRFVLHFTPPAEIVTTDQQCNIPGAINITQPGTADWTYTLTGANNDTLGTGTLNNNNSITVNAVAGTYTLTLVDNNNYTVVKTITVNGSGPITALFTPSDTLVEANADVFFNSTTPNATNYYWDFGDGTTSSGPATVHNYADTGTYTVTLIVISAGGCSSTTSETITVIKTATGIVSAHHTSPINIWSSDDRVFVDFTKQTKVEATIEIYNVLGQVISNEQFGRSTIYTKAFNNLQAAYVVVRVKNEGEVRVKRVFVGSDK